MDNSRAALTQLRDLLAAAIVDGDPRHLPGLSREYRLVLRDLDKLAAADTRSPIDEIRERRRRRIAAFGADSDPEVGSE